MTSNSESPGASSCTFAFTLVEMLIAAGVIVILVAVVVPMVNRARFRSAIVAEDANVSGIARNFDLKMDPSMGDRGMVRTYNDGHYRVDPNSLLDFAGVSARNWTDPFRRGSISQHSDLGKNGMGLYDKDFPVQGRGRVYLDCVSKDASGRYVLTGTDKPPAVALSQMMTSNRGEADWVNPKTIFMIISSGPDGVLDMRSDRDIMFAKIPSDFHDGRTMRIDRYDR